MPNHPVLFTVLSIAVMFLLGFQMFADTVVTKFAVEKSKYFRRYPANILLLAILCRRRMKWIMENPQKRGSLVKIKEKHFYRNDRHRIQVHIKVPLYGLVVFSIENPKDRLDGFSSYGNCIHLGEGGQKTVIPESLWSTLQAILKHKHRFTQIRIPSRE